MEATLLLQDSRCIVSNRSPYSLVVRLVLMIFRIQPGKMPVILVTDRRLCSSKNYALWVQPTNAYQNGDELDVTNGTFKYWISNEASGGGSYGYVYGS